MVCLKLNCLEKYIFALIQFSCGIAVDLYESDGLTSVRNGDSGSYIYPAAVCFSSICLDTGVKTLVNES